MKTLLLADKPSCCGDCEFFDPKTPDRNYGTGRCFMFNALVVGSAAVCCSRDDSTDEKLKPILAEAYKNWYRSIYGRKYNHEPQKRNALPNLQNNLPLIS